MTCILRSCAVLTPKAIVAFVAALVLCPAGTSTAEPAEFGSVRTSVESDLTNPFANGTANQPAPFPERLTTSFPRALRANALVEPARDFWLTPSEGIRFAELPSDVRRRDELSLAGMPPDQVGQAIQAALDATAAAGGGSVFLPAGEFEISQTLFIPSDVALVGHGRGITTIKLKRGSNTTMIKTRGDADSDAKNFAIRRLTLDGQYFLTPWNAKKGEYGNLTGNGIEITGYGFLIDCEINNIAGVGLLTQPLEFSIAKNDTVHYRIRVNGEVFGKEAFVHRGPGDGLVDEAFLGNAGILKRPEVETSTAMSDIYPNSAVDAIVFDRKSIEFDTIHVYANWSGAGLRTRNGPRVEGNHLISESNRSQVILGKRTYGAISKISVRNVAIFHPHWSGEIPNYSQPDENFDAITLDTDGFSVGQIVARRTITRVARVPGVTLLSVLGNGNQVRFVSNNSSPRSEKDADFGGRYTGDAIYIAGDRNMIDVNDRNTVGTVVRLRGGGSNMIRILSHGQQRSASGDAVFVRDASQDPSRMSSNRLTIVADDADVVMRSVGAPSSEVLDVTFQLKSGRTMFEGDGQRHPGQVWRFRGMVGNEHRALLE